MFRRTALFSSMAKGMIPLLLFLWTCATPPERPVLPASNPSGALPAPYQQGLMNSFDVYLFLKDSPTDVEVIETLGTPDSVWVDDDGTLKVYYYYVPEIRDYNSVEMDPENGKVVGFEWD